MSPVGASSSGLRQVMYLGILLIALFAWLDKESTASPPVSAPTVFPQILNTSIPLEINPVLNNSTNQAIVNISNTPKVQRAIIHRLETGQTDNSKQSVLSLPTCSDGQHISAWAPGYYILTFPCIDNLKVPYTVQLEPINPVDNLTYQWINASFYPNSSAHNCVTCHAGSSPNLNEYSEWAKDGHSKVFVTPYFGTTYMGTDVNGQLSQQIQWNILENGQKIYPLLDPMKSDYGAGYRLDYPVSNGNCALCHVPAGSSGTLREMDIAKLMVGSHGAQTSAETEGVTCDVCHKITDVLVGKDKLPYDDRPGILSLAFLRPNSDHRADYGPLAYQVTLGTNLGTDAKTTCFPVYSESRFCASCHYGKFANTLIYGSYKEWLDSPYREKYIRSADGQIIRENPDYRSCQDCHMIGQEKVMNTLPSQRDACSDTNLNFSNFNHNMMDYGPDPDNPSREIPLLVKNAAQMKLEPRLEGGQIKVKVTVLNTRAGHKFPTDSPLRHLILLVEARDWRGNNLMQSDGPMVPVWAVPDYAGYAGEIFANILKDKDTNLVPSFAYWNPVETAWQGADTRLVPGIPVQSEYSFAAPYDRSATLRATLIYRDVFFNVAKQKNWPIMDITVTEAGVECTGFGEVPENMTCQAIKQ